MTVAAMQMAGSSPVDLVELSTVKVVNTAPVTAKELEIDLASVKDASVAGSRWEDFLDFMAMGQRD
jgi:hypothetical protein